MSPTAAVDKDAAGVGERQYHIGIAPGEVSSVALLPGDPFRVPLVAEFLTDVKTVAHNREHMTMRGRTPQRRHDGGLRPPRIPRSTRPGHCDDSRGGRP